MERLDLQDVIKEFVVHAFIRVLKVNSIAASHQSLIDKSGIELPLDQQLSDEDRSLCCNLCTSRIDLQSSDLELRRLREAAIPNAHGAATQFREVPLLKRLSQVLD
jgi:hypothetical protein